MRYVYFSLGLLTIRVSSLSSDEYGELIGTSSLWDHANPGTKKFILATMIQNSPYRGITGLKIVDCDNPKPSDESSL